MGNYCCKKCGLSYDSHLIQGQKVTHIRKHCIMHNVKNGKCVDCKATHTQPNDLCYHSFSFSFLKF